MDNELALKKIQEAVDLKAKDFIKTALIKIVYCENLEDKDRYYCIGNDQPVLIYRVFDIFKDGKVTEVDDVNVCAEATKHFRVDILPKLDAVAPLVNEGDTYDIEIENPLDNGGVEIKLKSSFGREITMVEVYRYFDYVTKIFFVSCISLSYGGQYLFSVVPGGKQMKLVITNDPTIRERVNLINELLQNRVLPSYRTIEEGNQLLQGDIKAQISLNDKDEKLVKYQCNFCYDDPNTQTRFAFFGKLNEKGEEDEEHKDGVILVADIFHDNTLITAEKWTDEQKKSLDEIRAKMASNDSSVDKHIVSFFADDLDFRYKAYKEGTLTLDDNKDKVKEGN